MVTLQRTAKVKSTSKQQQNDKLAVLDQALIGENDLTGIS